MYERINTVGVGLYQNSLTHYPGACDMNVALRLSSSPWITRIAMETSSQSGAVFTISRSGQDNGLNVARWVVRGRYDSHSRSLCWPCRVEETYLSLWWAWKALSQTQRVSPRQKRCFSQIYRFKISQWCMSFQDRLVCVSRWTQLQNVWGQNRIQKPQRIPIHAISHVAMPRR